jgi:hypothetical protein
MHATTSTLTTYQRNKNLLKDSPFNQDKISWLKGHIDKQFQADPQLLTKQIAALGHWNI